MRVFVSAGEVSGDQSLAAILAALRPRLPDLQVAGLGGEAAEAQGLAPLVPLVSTAVSGVGDVLATLPALWRARRAALACLEGRSGPRPDLAILVDYPGMNLGLARRARALGIPVYYVAPPQAWRYREREAKVRQAARSLAGSVVHVLFPFEKALFAPAAARVVAGHFLSEAGAAGARRPGAVSRVLALCPGSRAPALGRNLPAWLAALAGAGLLPLRAGGEIGGALLLVPPHLAAEAEALLRAAPRGAGRGIEVVTDKGRIFRDACWAFAFPGTITLELALAGIPAAILCAADALTLALGRRALKGPWLGLPNLLLGEEACPEWVGPPETLVPRVAAALWERLRDPSRPAMPAAGARLRALLGPADGAVIAAAECLKILAAR